MNQLVHASQYANDKYTLKSSKARKEKEEVKFKRHGSTNDDDIESDVIELDSDFTIRDIEVNKPVARKRYAQKHSFVSKKGFLKSSLRVCSRTFTKVALMLAIVISILGGLFNIKLPKRKSTIGTSSSLSPSKPRVVLRFHGYSALSILRESAAAIIGISEGLCSCIHKVMFLNNSKQLTRCMKVLQNTIIRGVTIFTNRSPSSRLKLCAPYCCPDYATRAPTTFAKNVLAGKRLDAYIIPSADFCASHVDYLDTYTINLESDYNFTAFYNLRYIYIYIYIYLLFTVRGHLVIGQTYSKVIFYTLVYFSLNWIVSVIRSHDKYQSLILIGLAFTGKASSRIQYILFHFRSYWRGWRPLVTPWACSIKEGIPRISQKWFFPSHAQVSVYLCCPLLLFSCFCFYCSYCYYYYYYGYLLAKGFYYNSGYENKPGPYYSSGYENKPGHFNKQKLLPCPMLCFPLCSLLFSLSLSLSLLMVF